VDSGWIAVRTRLPSPLRTEAGNFKQGLRSLGLEAMVNCLRQ